MAKSMDEEMYIYLESNKAMCEVSELSIKSNLHSGTLNYFFL